MSSPESARTAPKRSRPNMPDYGISTEPKGLMSWDWVDEQMAKSRNYWICSTRPDGRPHSAPVWGVWLDGVLYFSCSRRSRKARNFDVKPAVAVHLESGDDAVMLEGEVEEIKDKALLARIVDLYAVKYPPFRPDPDSEPGNVFYGVKPQSVFAWQERDFPNTATRWKFDGN
jgi:nitroimidazol reductase NimA-like FMN-containing flavoprotein (pyridoxamine 5'-phosphate oxidase superfamily)